MVRKNAAETQEQTKKGETREYTTHSCSPALAPYWHNASVARLAGPKGLAEVTPGLASVLASGEYLVACSQKRFLAGPDPIELVAATGAEEPMDVWTTCSVQDLWQQGDRVRREIRGQVQRMGITDADGAQPMGKPREVFFAVTLSARDVEKFDVKPTGEVPERENRPVSMGCAVAQAARAKRKHKHGHASGGAVRSAAAMASLGNFI